MRPPRVLAVLAALLLAPACAQSAPQSPGAAGRLEPLTWFLGPTHNDGTLRTLTGEVQRLVVDGVGRRLPDGSLELRQVIRRGAEPPAARTWRIAATAPNRWSLSGTDMGGPGRAWRDGDAVILDWPRRNGDLQVRQRLVLAPGGRVINTMTLSRLGLTLADVREVIVRGRRP